MRGMESKVRSHVHTLNRVHNSRYFYNANVDVQSLFVSKEDWFTWFKQANAWRKVSHGMSYAEVVNKNVHNNRQKVQSLHCVQNKNKVNQVEPKPSTPVHVVRKCVPKNTVVQHTVNRGSSRNQHKPQLPPIITTNRFQVLQDTLENGSDQRNASDLSVLSDDGGCNEQTNARSANCGTKVLDTDNIEYNIVFNTCVDNIKEC